MIDLVIGAAATYTTEMMRPFVLSIRNSGYSGRIVLFGDNLNFQGYGVDVIPCPPRTSLYHSDRFRWILDALPNILCDSVLCVDTRDTIFQSDLSELPDDDINMFEEDRSMTLGTCPYNSDWLKTGYGSLMGLDDKPICCVGTFCGSKRHVAGYLAKLVDEINILQPKTSKFQDQAAHNKLIYIDGIGIVHQNGYPVYTVGYVKKHIEISSEIWPKPLALPSSLLTPMDCNVIFEGKVPALLHQWDRHINLRNLVEIKYAHNQQ